MAIKHSFSLNSIKPQVVTATGSRTSVTAKELPILAHTGISTSVLKLAPGCAREPHWHPNAAEMTYCVKGSALVTIFSPKAGHSTFTMEPGEIFYVPKGYIHHIANTSEIEAEFIITFSHAQPEDINLSEAINSMNSNVLAATFGEPKGFFEKIQNKKLAFITSKKVTEKPPLPFITSPYKMSLEKINPQVFTDGGSAKIANHASFSILEDLALFSLRINGHGVREPHWHPNAGELNYVVKGRARLTIFTPGGDVDTFEIGPGEGSYIPVSYFHYIENCGGEELHMTVFFSNSAPSDLGISGALSAYSNELLAGVFDVPEKHFEELKRYQEDVRIVAGKV